MDGPAGRVAKVNLDTSFLARKVFEYGVQLKAVAAPSMLADIRVEFSRIQ